ncbi:hypothetical protein CBR_g30241 [Chara braunii]|uniref:Sialidase domain-containing protein n=1 Tax=Chara braunii TaxID=69332 RepID=A0A388LCE7_CHABU|nr:hypothetical protein CBR_g30241 [Chara braunii]|eukprot:GBG79980.1 hypothetical protein CBR_g30241 [Chara braunii]
MGVCRPSPSAVGAGLAAAGGAAGAGGGIVGGGGGVAPPSCVEDGRVKLRSNATCVEGERKDRARHSSSTILRGATLSHAKCMLPLLRNGRLASSLLWVLPLLIWFYIRLTKKTVMFDHSNIAYRWAYKINRDPNGTILDSLAYVHMGMVESLPNGSICAVFQGSESNYEGSVNQNLYWTTSSDGGKTWSKMEVLLKGDGVALWSPVVLSESGRVWLFFSRSSRRCKYYDRSRGVTRFSPGGDLQYASSDDSGLSWTTPQTVYSFEAEEGMPKVIANKICVLSTGAWVLPFWREPGRTCPPKRILPVLEYPQGSGGVLISGDQGLTWSVHGRLSTPETWLIENTVAELRDHTLLQFFRSKKNWVYQSTSQDMGQTWSPPTPTVLLNPDSKVHLLSLPNGHLLCAFNPSPTKRTPLFISLSRNDGNSWNALAHLETDSSKSFSYPTMLAFKGKLLTIYSVMAVENFRSFCVGMKVAILQLQGSQVQIS